MDELERQEQLLRQAMQELQETSTVTADTFSKLSRETNSFTKSIEKAEESMDRFWRSGLGKATRAAGDIAKGFVDSANAARENRESFESLNPAITGVATALRAIPIIGQALGDTLQGVGTFVTAEMQKNIEAFNKLGTVGALGGEGVSGLRDSAVRAGLSLQQFSGIITDNAKTLAFATGSTMNGAQALTELTEAAGQTGLRRQFRALGADLTEQSTVFAEYLEFSRLLGTQQSRDYRKQASAAGEYLLRLDELSRVTGLTRDQAQRALEEQRADARFVSAQRRAVARFGPDLGETISAQMEDAMILVGELGDPTLAKSVRDLFGGPGTKSAQEALAALGPEAMQASQALQTGQIDQYEFARVIAASSRNFQERFRETLPVIAGANTVFENLIVGTGRLGEVINLSNEEIEALRKAQRDAKSTQDEQTGNLINAAESLQTFAQQMDAFVANNVMPKATELVGKFADSLSYLMTEINKLTEGKVRVPDERALGGPIKGGEPYMVGERGPEIVVPNASGTVLTNNEVEARYATVQKALASTLSLVEGFKSAFLPGIGQVTQQTTSGGEQIQIKGLDGAIETFNKYVVGNMTARQYTAGDQTYAAGTYNVNDLQANTGYFPTSGPRSMYESMLAGVADPMADASFQQKQYTGRESYEMKELPLNKEAMALLTELKNTMVTVASNTKTGADTNKKLLRATTG